MIGSKGIGAIMIMITIGTCARPHPTGIRPIMLMLGSRPLCRGGKVDKNGKFENTRYNKIKYQELLMNNYSKPINDI